MSATGPKAVEKAWGTQKRRRAAVRAPNALGFFPLVFKNTRFADEPYLGRSYLSKGMLQQAIEEMETARRVAPNDPYALGFLGYAYAVAGRRADALKALQTLDEMEKQHYVTRMARVYIYAGLGDKDKAFEWLEKAYQERADTLAWFRKDPESKSLQSDPRFAALMRKIGFTEP